MAKNSWVLSRPLNFVHANRHLVTSTSVVHQTPYGETDELHTGITACSPVTLKSLPKLFFSLSFTQSHFLIKVGDQRPSALTLPGLMYSLKSLQGGMRSAACQSEVPQTQVKRWDFFHRGSHIRGQVEFRSLCMVYFISSFNCQSRVQPYIHPFVHIFICIPVCCVGWDIPTMTNSMFFQIHITLWHQGKEKKETNKHSEWTFLSVWHGEVTFFSSMTFILPLSYHAPSAHTDTR